jgi:hypothetical protein
MNFAYYDNFLVVYDFIFWKRFFQSFSISNASPAYNFQNLHYLPLWHHERETNVFTATTLPNCTNRASKRCQVTLAS